MKNSLNQQLLAANFSWVRVMSIESYTDEQFTITLQLDINQGTGARAVYFGTNSRRLEILQNSQSQNPEPDIPSGMIRVAATVQRISYPGMPPNDTPKTHLIITRPKSPSSYRLIPVSELLLPILMDYYSEPSDYLLTGLSRPMEPRTLQNRFQTALRQIPIYGASFHTLRHTFATRCVEAGFEIKSLSEILGHASVNITLNRYVHSSWETKRANMRKMDQFLNTL